MEALATWPSTNSESTLHTHTHTWLNTGCVNCKQVSSLLWVPGSSLAGRDTKLFLFSADIAITRYEEMICVTRYMQVKCPQPHCTRSRFPVGTDSLSAVTMALSPLFKLLACIMKPQNSTKECSYAGRKKYCLLPETPHKGKTTFALVPCLEVKPHTQLCWPSPLPVQVLGEVRLGLLMQRSYFKCKTKETSFVLNAK